MPDTLDLLTWAPKAGARIRECNGEDDRDEDPSTDDEFVKVTRGLDVMINGRRIQTWTWTGDPNLAEFDRANDAKAAANRYYDRKLRWWEEEPNYWMAERPGCRMTEAWRSDEDDCDGEDGLQSWRDPAPATPCVPEDVDAL
jgi:hypothetical protein